MRETVLCLFLALCASYLFAQDTSHLNLSVPQSGFTAKKCGTIDPQANIRVTNFIAPVVFISYGVIALHDKALRNLNLSTRAEIKEDHPSFKTHIDNYLQYSPAAAVFVLQLAGVKGKNPPIKEATILATSLAISAILVQPVKSWAHEQRPDNSNHKSFPSGHTTTAFAGAEFLRIEYGRASPLIAISGYAAALTTAVLRVYNNKHWVSDVIAGAGFGILSTDLVYWVNDKFFWKKKHSNNLALFPVYHSLNFGLGLVKIF